MNAIPSEAIKLYGTEESVPPMQQLQAGPLTATFDQGALRYIKVNGTEAIRNIAFVVRNKDWGTYSPSISEAQIDQSDEGFTVSYSAACGNDSGQIDYQANIEASSNGELVFTVKYQATSDFETNRTGFVVLHPISGVAGESVTVEEVDGRVFDSVFPKQIDPVQPFKNLRALTHRVSKDTRIRCEMTGDTFEMEDHRQWNDASFKTYVRPLELPWPYTVPKDTPMEQSVRLSVQTESNKNSISSVDASQSICKLNVISADKSLTMPCIGLGLEPQHLNGAEQKIELVKKLGVQQLVVWHEIEKHGVAELSRAAELGKKLNVDLVLHAVIPDDSYQSEIAALRNQCKEARFSAKAICVSPSAYLQSIMPGPNWPVVTSLDAIYDEVRSKFPDAMTGGGMLAFFPEINRHKPPIKHLDYVTHASNTITHASDDVTAMENLEALPHIIDSCRAFIEDKPYHLGPSSIGMRFNPYGSATMDNPQNIRTAMARMDPRQRGLLNAAWTVGYLAHAAHGQVHTVNLHAPTGEFGVIYNPQAWSQPGFDGTDRCVFPVYHVVAGFASAYGHSMCPVTNSMSREVAAVAYKKDGRQTIWIANLTSQIQNVELSGLDVSNARVSALTIDNWDNCTLDSSGMNETESNLESNRISLGSYDVVCTIV